MPRKKKIEQYEHKDKTRVNNPEVGLVDAALEPPEQKKSYAYDPHLDPSLQWAGKAERTSFEVPSVSLHVHERIDPRTIIEAVRRRNGNGAQMSLFSAREMNPPLREAIEFYKHRHNWTNRLIAGDSLLVMNSLIEKETLAGQVQMFYFRSALRDQIRLKLPALRKQARREGRQGRRPDERTGNAARLSRHLGAGDSFLSDLSARPAVTHARATARERLDLCPDQRRERASRPRDHG
jgi:hypothetical protein